MGPITSTTDRSALVRRGRWLSVVTLVYNALEGLVAVMTLAPAP